MKILVTGAGGVLGQAFQAIQGDYPQHNFTFWRSVDCNLLNDAWSLRLTVGDVAPEAIIHLAAVSGGVGLSAKHPATLLRDNTRMTLNVLDVALACDVAKVIMSLSSGMYPANAPLPLRESSMHDGYPHESNYAYAFAKRLIDPAIRAYRSEYGLNVIGLIPNGMFGEGDNFNLDDCNMVAALIRRFHAARHTKDSVTVWGDGTPLREFTYAKDMARAYMWALENYDGADCLNVGTTEERSVAEIAGMIATMVGIYPERITFDASKPSGPLRKNTDNSKFLALSGFSYTPFLEGLRRTIKWYGETYRDAPELIRTGPKVRDN